MIALLDGGYYAHWSAATKRPCTMAELRRRLTAKFGLDVDLWLAEDCPRDACWRRSVYAGYKRGRPADMRTQKTASAVKTLSGANLEADDCIAIAVRELSQKQATHIVIISSDMDFLQLSGSMVTVVDINMRPIRGHRGFACVMAKALGGDATDGIPPAWRGCGPATVDRCLRNADYLQFKLADKVNLAGYLRNRALVDFAAIPERYRTLLRSTTPINTTNV